MPCVQESVRTWPSDRMLALARTDRVALNEVVGGLFRVVAMWANGFQVHRGIDRDDLVSLGLEVAVDAIRGYSPARGVPFPKYLRLCVERRWRAYRTAQHPAIGGFDADNVADVRDRLAQEATGAQVREILGKLDRGVANLLCDAYGIGVERVAVDEIARRNGVPSGTQHSRLRDAMAEFREKWE
jgi:DNA-directed RNA polymerase specialized sigma24 family protein